MGNLHALDARPPAARRRATAAPARADLAAQARACLAAAEAANELGHFRQGMERSRQALAIGETIADTALQAAALSSLALQELRLGDGEAAVIASHRTLALLKRTRDAAMRGRTLCTLVLSYLCIGLHKDALLYASQALEVAREVGDPALMSWAFNRAGSAYKALGEPLRAQRLFEEALRMARASAGREELFAALNNLSGNTLALARTLPDPERAPVMAEALRHATEALQLSLATGLSLQQATCHSILARLHIAGADHERALAHATLALDLSTRDGYRLIEMSALLHRGAIERHRGDLDRSIEFYNQVLLQARGSDDHDWVKEAHQGLAESHRQRNDAGPALEHLEASRLLERRLLEQRADAQVRVLLNRRDIDGAASPGSAAPRPDEPPAALLRPAAGTCIAVVAPDDIDQLHQRHGVAAIAEIQRTLWRLISGTARNTDFVSQLDDVAFLVGHAETALEVAAAVCERLRATIEAHPWGRIAEGLDVTVTIALCAVGEAGTDDPIHRAVRALQAAQERGRNRVARPD
jgi:diguanylate cyclase